MIRADLDVASTIDISLGQRKPSEFSGYDTLPVTFSQGEHKQTLEFLISKDSQKLLRLRPLEDVGQEIALNGRPSRGPKDAPITIIVYDDFQCPYCRDNHALLFGEVMKEYDGKIRVFYKDYPLFQIHPWAGHAAVDANCLAAQNLAAQNNDAYWQFADYVHSHGKADITGHDRPLSDQFATLDKVATDIGSERNLNMQQLQACVKAQDDSAVKASVKEGDAVGVDGTPTMFIDGKRTSGALPLEEYRALLDRDLRDAGLTPPTHPAPQAQGGDNSKGPPKP